MKEKELFLDASFNGLSVQNITHSMYMLRLKYGDYIVKTAKQVTTTGEPMIRFKKLIV